MPEPERHTPVSAPRPVQAGLGVEDIRHIPVQKRELRFTRNRAGAILTAAGGPSGSHRRFPPAHGI